MAILSRERSPHYCRPNIGLKPLELFLRTFDVIFREQLKILSVAVPKDGIAHDLQAGYRWRLGQPLL
jgi:hypothetical protein